MVESVPHDTRRHVYDFVGSGGAGPAFVAGRHFECRRHG
jgi:hypothetical protein